MLLSANLMRFHNVFGIKKTIENFSESGVEGIDFNNDIKEFHNGTHDESYFKDLKSYANERGVIFGQTHAPFASSFADESLTEQRFSEIVASMSYSACLDAPYIVVHPCQHFVYSKANNDAMYEYNMKFYKRLIPYYEKYGVKIAIENVNLNDKASVISTPEALCKIYDELNNEAFVVCFDVGHANNLSGVTPADAIRTLGSRIKCLHVHDNNGLTDSHTLPFYGNIEWDSVTKALADINYEGTFNYEAAGFLTRLPNELCEEGARMMSAVGHNLIDKIEYYKNNR